MQAWCTAWWKAEREEALRQLDDLTDAPNAWQPALTLLTTPDSDPSLGVLEDEIRCGGRLRYKQCGLYQLLRL
jgi:hypothetical protein